MPNVTNNNVYDMGGMSYKENISKRIAEFTRENLFIGIPARVVSVSDYSTLQCLDVQPVINDIYTKHNNIILEANVIKKVFVLLERAGGFSIEMPVAKGDIVTLFWGHKDLGEWLDSDGTQQISQSVFKIANIEDCWCELRGGTRKDNLKPSTSNFVIRGDNTTFTITPSGVVTCETSGTSYLKSSAHTIDTDTTITGNLTVNGNTQVDGTTTSTGLLTASAGVYAASYAGLSGGSATFNVDMNITGTVTINGVVVNEHNHTYDGGTTGPMQ